MKELVPTISRDTNFDQCLGFISLGNYTRISFAIGLGRHIDHIDVNYDKLSAYMQRRGLTTEQAGSTNIHFTSEREEVDNGEGDLVLRAGYYSMATDVITINPRCSTDVFSQTIKNVLPGANTPDKKQFLKDWANQNSNKELSQTLAHEIEHRKLRLTGEASKMLAGFTASKSVSPHQQYLDQPDEKHCREVEKTAPTGLVTVRLKQFT